MRFKRTLKSMIGIIVICAILAGAGFLIYSIINSSKANVYYETMLEGVVVEDVINQEKGTVVTTPTPISEGYDFKGWYLDRNYSAFSNPGGVQITLTQNKLQLFAKWEIKTFNVTLINNNALNPNDRQVVKKVNYKDSFDLSEYTTQDTAVGYTSRWVQIVNGIQQEVADDTQPIIVRDNLRFEMVKTPKTYTIKYVYLDGAQENLIAEDTMLYDTAFDFSKIDTTRVGYNFDCWKSFNDLQVAGGVTKLNTDIYGVSSGNTITLYANYTLKSFEISFNYVDDDSQNIKMDFVRLDYGSLVWDSDLLTRLNEIESNPLLNKAHYDFVGWEYDGEVIDKTTFVVPDGNVELFASYSPKEYQVRYFYNIGDGNIFLDNPSIIEYGSALEGTIPTAEAIELSIGEFGDAYRLIGLKYNSVTYTTTEFIETFTSIEGHMDVELVMEKWQLFVNYYAGNGTTIYESVLINKDNGVELPENPGEEFAPDGDATYIFGRWYLLGGATFDETYDITELTDDLDVYSEWFENNSANWSYEMDGDYATVTGYNGTASCVCIPSTVVGASDTIINVKGVGFVSEDTSMQNVSGKKILIPTTVTKIQDYAFQNLSVEIIFDYTTSTNPLEIGAHAFGSYYNETNLLDTSMSIKTIRLPARTVSVDSMAFFSASKLESINVEDGCTRFKSVDGVLYETIDDEIILKAIPKSKLSSGYTIPSEVTAIGDDAFNFIINWGGSIASWNIVIKDSENSQLKKIGKNAFYRDNFKSFDFSHSLLETIDENAFMNSLNYNTFGANGGFVFNQDMVLTYIGDNAFANNVGVTNFVLDQTDLENLGVGAFYNFTIDSTQPETNFKLKLGGTFTTIGTNTFVGCGLPIEIVNANQVATISDNAFGSLTIRNITVKSNIISAVFDEAITLGTRCFGNTNIEYMELNNVANIPAETFYKSSITTLKVDRVETLANGLFRQNTAINKLVNFEFGDNCTFVKLPDHTFRDNTLLESVVLCDSITTLGELVFNGCTALTEMILPSSLQIINNNCFAGCTNLASIEFPNTLTKIGSRVFENCSSLAVAEFNSKITIGQNAFAGTALVNVNIEATNIMSEVFLGCTSLKSANIVVNKIYQDVFKNCTALEVVSVKFEGTNATLGAIFNACTSLQKFILSGEIPTIYQNVQHERILYPNGEFDIYVPSGMKEAYLNFEDEESDINVWSEYEEKIREITITNNAIIDEGTVLMVIGNVDEVTISAGTTLGEYAFSGMTKLSKLHLNTASVLTVNDISKTFASVDLTNLVIKVPTSEMVDFYKASSFWQTLADNIVQETV